MQDPFLRSLPPPVADDAGAQPWRPEEPLGHHALDTGRHGYLVGGQLEWCDRAGMVAHLAQHPSTPGVYVAGAGGLARPEEVPGLLDEYRREAVRRARRTVLWIGLFAAAAVGIMAWLLVRWDVGVRSLPGLVAVFAVGYLGLALHGVHVARRATPDVFARARQGLRHTAWASGQPAPFTWALIIPLGVTYVLTTMDVAIPRAALVKPAVWEGEAWRMLTGPMLHAGFYHLWMNLAALMALGRIVEAHTTRFHLAVVFLFSVLGGSVLSVLLSPRTSVGASGGVMGLVGFLWMMARLRPRTLPDDFGERMQYAVGATALIGVLGFQFIDNWAHLGGLLAGAALAWLLMHDRAEGLPEGPLVPAAGWLSLAILLWAMVVAIAVTWGAFGG